MYLPDRRGSRQAAAALRTSYTAAAMFSFRIGPFPVRVYAWFFLSAVLLGQSYGFGWRMAAWIFVVFVSVLCHELGHAVVGRVFGGHPEIHLQAFGGVTFPQFRKSPGPGRQFVLSVAGPLFGLFLGAAAWGLVQFFPPARGSPALCGAAPRRRRASASSRPELRSGRRRSAQGAPPPRRRARR